VTDLEAYEATEPGYGYVYADYAGCLFFSVHPEGLVVVDDHGERHQSDELIAEIGPLTLVARPHQF